MGVRGRIFLRRRWPWLAASGGALIAAAALLAATIGPEACGTSGAGIGCGTPALKPHQPDVSVVTAVGHLTGRTTAVDGAIDHEMELQQVHVLTGPARSSTLTGWLATVPDPGPGLAAAQVPGLWSPDGQLLAYVPAHPEQASGASTISVRPVVDDRVVFNGAGCGYAPPGVKTARFTGPLAEVPGSRSYTVARCNGGFRSSPLTQIERLLD